MASNSTGSEELYRSGAANWVRNQRSNPFPASSRYHDLAPFASWAWACVALGVMVLAQQLALVRLRRESARLCSFLCGLGLLLMGCLLSAASSGADDPAAFAWLFDVGVVGISGTLIRAGDNTVFLLCLANLTKSQLTSQRFIPLLVYVLVVLYLTWLPVIFLLPFFFNLNADFMTNTLIPILVQYAPNIGNIALNIGVIIRATMAVYHANSLNAIRVPKRVQLHCIKCIFHSIARY